MGVPGLPDDDHVREPDTPIDATDQDAFAALVEGLGALTVEQAEGFERGLRHLREIRRQFDDPRAQPHISSEPCPSCETHAAVLIVKDNQTTVRCQKCRRLIERTFKPKSGEERGTESADPLIEPSRRTRILDRDAGRCVLCGSSERLSVGHLLAVADGIALGATAAELNSDANLAALCEVCSVGRASGPASVSARTYASIMWRLVQAELGRTAAVTAGGLSSPS